MLNKVVKSNNKKLIISIIFIIIAIISLYGYKIFNDKIKTPDNKPVDYNDLIVNGTDQDNMYVTIDITDIPYQIAEQRVNYSYIKYYILYDKNDYMYVAKLSDNTYKKINDQYQKNKENFSYTLTGYIYKTPKDLKEIIIDIFNEENINTEISLDTYDNYFGSTYFDDSYTKYTTPTAICLIIAIVSIISFIVILINWIICAVNTKKTMSNLNKEELEQELSKKSLKEYKKAKIYLTDKFLISTYRGLHVFKYQDIGWIYIGDNISKISIGNKICMNIFMKSKFKYRSKSLDFDKEQTFNEIISEIANKNQNIMFGYTYENMDKYNKMNS